MPTKQPIKAKLATQNSRQESASSFNQSTNTGDKIVQSRSSSLSGIASKSHADKSHADRSHADRSHADRYHADNAQRKTSDKETLQ